MNSPIRFSRRRAEFSPRASGALWLAALLLLALPAGAAADSVPRVLYPESIRPISPAAPGEPGGRALRPQPRLVRAALTAAETAATMDFALPLRMRNFAELQARVARGEIIPRAEMAAKYLPLAADYDRVAAWAVARGFTLTYPDASNLTVFARAPVSRVAEVFQTTFGRVSDDGGEYTSALTAPSVPMALAPALLSINGLQPHLRAHKLASVTGARPMSLSSPNSPPYVPAELRRAYNATTTGLTGAGQTIAIVIDTYLLESDLTLFWQNSSVTPVPAPIQRVIVASGTATDTAEATIDAELTSSMAPGATIRMYTTGDLGFTALDQAYHQIFNDLPTQPGLHQVNLSFGIGEAYHGQTQNDAQIFAALAASGVTILASTGDGGSNPNPDTGAYSASAVLQPILPAADPSVTGVGGTTLFLNTATGAISSETGWSLTRDNHAGGGGISTIFSRPSWQVGTGVPTGTQRLVPDVSIVADVNTGAYIILNGSANILFGGTSISAPIWTGFCTLVNQARATAGQQPLGLFGPHLYPLIGSTSLHDITSGNNGAYNAGIGYDMVTGVGTPDVAALVQALGAANFAPTITTQPASQTVAAGQNATFTVAANGSPAPSYRWQHRAVGGSIWTDLTDSAPFSGTITATLTVSAVTDLLDGDSFQCVVTNPAGTATSSPAALIVASPLTIITLAGSAGTSGSADGTGATARFNSPSDVAVDGTGTVYVTDTNNHTIRKITPAGVVSTLAGLAGSSGSADGTGSAARFNHPTGIAVNSAGDLYVADTDNNTIRKITAAGVVTTLPGQFNAPSDVSVVGSGNIYVAAAGDHTIRVITPTGIISILAGVAGSPGNNDGAAGGARFRGPEGLVADGVGNVYVADAGNSTIRKISATGVVSTLAGLAGISGTSDGVGSGARFQFPSDLALGAAGLYVVDTDNQTIRQINAVGATGTVAGQVGVIGSSDGRGGSARFNHPTGVAVDNAGDIYIADTDNHTIRKSTTAVGPTITTQPQSQTVTTGFTAQFSVIATGTPAPTYQWQFNGAAIAGATSATLTLNGAQSSNAGTYTVVVTNTAGSVTSNPATLTVTAVTPPPPSGGGGGGGGAPSLWFLAALSLLAVVRKTFRRP